MLKLDLLQGRRYSLVNDSPGGRRKRRMVFALESNRHLCSTRMRITAERIRNKLWENSQRPSPRVRGRIPLKMNNRWTNKKKISLAACNCLWRFFSLLTAPFSQAADFIPPRLHHPMPKLVRYCFRDLFPKAAIQVYNARRGILVLPQMQISKAAHGSNEACTWRGGPYDWQTLKWKRCFIWIEGIYTVPRF